MRNPRHDLVSLEAFLAEIKAAATSLAPARTQMLERAGGIKELVEEYLARDEGHDKTLLKVADDLKHVLGWVEVLGSAIGDLDQTIGKGIERLSEAAEGRPKEPGEVAAAVQVRESEHE